MEELSRLQAMVGIREPLDIQIRQGDTRPHPGNGRLYGDNRLTSDDINWTLRKVLGLVKVP
jgi:hypothetical protein